uniref:Uncharacterized protein n=1 Tax=Solanum lycopersicum TaxID=4081 RepID=A0A3Q7IFB3_SOLLC
MVVDIWCKWEKVWNIIVMCKEKSDVCVFYRKRKKRYGKEEEEEDSGPYRSLPSFGLLACCSLNSQNIQMYSFVQ